ncbi:MAG: MarR family transcriptional regulator [Euryarchaeota archaeon]|nr:MarR family transcriptional regulator [Euryarchaeota archaeon]
MPIDIERFEGAPENELHGGGETHADRVLSFLATHSEQAFTPKEIREETGIARGSIGVVLSRLEERELVRHRGEYWAISNERDAATTLTAMEAARAVTERFGPEDPDEWGPGVDGESTTDSDEP